MELKRVVRASTLEKIHGWLAQCRPPGARLVMDGAYYVLVDEGRHLAAVALRRLAWFATEIRHLVVAPEERRKGYGGRILMLALSKVRTPLTVATVRGDLPWWLAENVAQGFSDVAAFPCGGSTIHFLVRLAPVSGGEAERTSDVQAERRPSEKGRGTDPSAV